MMMMMMMIVTIMIKYLLAFNVHIRLDKLE